MVSLLTKWRRAEQALYRQRGCAPNSGEVASFLGPSEIQKSLVAKAHQARRIKLESGLGAKNGRRSPEEPRGRHEAPDAVMESDDDRRVLLRRMKGLDQRERTVLALRYGFEGKLPLTHKEIGRRLGITREWVRKIEFRALRRLNADSQEHARGSRRSRQPRRDRRMPARSMACVDPGDMTECGMLF
jgi:RNA polymerase primary sigma factor